MHLLTTSALLRFLELTMDEKKILEVMALADAYADVCFDQGLHQRKDDGAPESSRTVLLEKLLEFLVDKQWRNHFEDLLELTEQHADFANGVTDPTGTIDEGRVIGAEQLARFRALLGEQHG